MNLRSINPAEIAILLGIAGITAVFYLDSGNYSPAARLVPSIFILTTAILLGLRVAVIVYRVLRPGAGVGRPQDSAAEEAVGHRYLLRSVWVLGAIASYIVMIWLVGMHPAIFVFVLAFSRAFGPLKWLHSVALALGTWTLSYLLFGRLLGMPPIEGILL